MKRFDLEGLRLRLRGSSPDDVHLVIDGVLRLLDPVLARHGLFSDWNQAWLVDPSHGLDHGRPISAVGTGLYWRGARAMLQINCGPLRWIADPETFERFAFNRNRIADRDPGIAEGDPLRCERRGNGELAIADARVGRMDARRLRHLVEPVAYRASARAPGAVGIDPAGVQGRLCRTIAARAV